MNLYNKYRPRTLMELVGNAQLKDALQSFVDKKRPWPTAVLFTGPSGTGKTTVAQIMAKEIGCDEIDLIVLDAADDRGIDAIRNIRSQSHRMPLAGNVRVWILDECHKLTNDAQNALLKCLEQPPQGVYFMLATTDPKSLLKTVRTRCTTFEMELLTVPDLVCLLSTIVDLEDENISKDMLRLIAESAEGSPRDAISSLEYVLALPEKNRNSFSIEQARQENTIKDLCQAMIKAQKWSVVSGILSDIKDDPETVRRSILGYMSAVLLNSKTGNYQAALVMECFREPFYNTGKPGLVLACHNALVSN